MYICCSHCKHTGNFIHEVGHACRKHDKFINFNNLESMEFMFNCKDCELDIGELLRVARYMDTISFEVVFDEYFQVMNNMGVVIKDRDKWNHGFYKCSFTEVYKPFDVKNTHVKGYRLLFNNYPVFYTENFEEILFIQQGLGLINRE